MRDRSYTDEELALIIKRAARIHDSTSETRHSLADVQDIGEQVGLPREIVAAVARDLARPDDASSLLRMLLGPSGRFVTSVEVARRVTPQDYPSLLEVIRAEMKTAGHATQVGPQLEWRFGEGLNRYVGHIIITVTPGADIAKVRIETDIRPMRTQAYVTGVLLGAVAGLIGSVEAGAAPHVVAAIICGATSFGWALTHAVWRRVRRSAEARDRRIGQAIASHLELPG